MMKLKFTDLTFEKIQDYDPFNKRANAIGMAQAGWLEIHLEIL